MSMLQGWKRPRPQRDGNPLGPLITEGWGSCLILIRVVCDERVGRLGSGNGASDFT